MIKLFYQLVRFLGIGFLNTAVDFAVLNFAAASFGVYTGLRIGALNVISFTIAVLHSYFWNKYWAFGNHEGEERFWRNFFQAVATGFLGATIIALVLVGAAIKLAFGYYFLLLAVLVIGEVTLWKIFKLQKDPLAVRSSKEFLLFVVISVIGTLINSGIVAGGTSIFPPQFGVSQELWTNLVKAAATGISLIWNFLGYKLLVFKR